LVFKFTSTFIRAKTSKNLPFDLAPASLSVSRLGLCSVGPLANQRPYNNDSNTNIKIDNLTLGYSLRANGHIIITCD
jgi:hypothetical protein